MLQSRSLEGGGELNRGSLEASRLAGIVNCNATATPQPVSTVDIAAHLPPSLAPCKVPALVSTPVDRGRRRVIPVVPKASPNHPRVVQAPPAARSAALATEPLSSERAGQGNKNPLYISRLSGRQIEVEILIQFCPIFPSLHPRVTRLGSQPSPRRGWRSVRPN